MCVCVWGGGGRGSGKESNFFNSRFGFSVIFFSDWVVQNHSSAKKYSKLLEVGRDNLFQCKCCMRFEVKQKPCFFFEKDVFEYFLKTAKLIRDKLRRSSETSLKILRQKF